MEDSADITSLGRAQERAPRPDPRLADTTDIGLTELGAERAGPSPHVERAVAREPLPEDTGSARLIRPYAMTGGRTSAHPDISLESQVQTSTRLNGDSTTYRWEAAKILKLAERPMALVELAARAEIPIGVARVVISDLVDAGVVNVQRKVAVTSYTSLLEKVLDGIRDL